MRFARNPSPRLRNGARTTFNGVPNRLDSRFRGNDGVKSGNDGLKIGNSGALTAPSRLCVKFIMSTRPNP